MANGQSLALSTHASDKSERLCKLTAKLLVAFFVGSFKRSRARKDTRREGEEKQRIVMSIVE